MARTAKVTEEDLRRLEAQGKTRDEQAEILGVHFMTIGEARKRYGMPPLSPSNVRRAFDPGITTLDNPFPLSPAMRHLGEFDSIIAARVAREDRGIPKFPCGHPKTDDNITLVGQYGHKTCLTCKRLYQRRARGMMLPPQKEGEGA